MDTNIIITLLGTIISTFGAVVISYVTTQKTLAIIIAKLQVKVDTLWDIYAIDAIRSAQKNKLIAEHSRPQPTEIWKTSIPLNLSKSISLYLQTSKASTPKGAAIEILHKFKNEFILIADTLDSDAKAVFGTVLTICQIYWERERSSEH